MAARDHATGRQNLAQEGPWPADADETLRSAALARGYAPDLTDIEREDILDLVEADQLSTLESTCPAVEAPEQEAAP